MWNMFYYFLTLNFMTNWKKGDEGNNPFQWRLIALIQLAGLYTDAI